MPFALADRCASTVPSQFKSNSNWATAAKIANTKRPPCELVSMASVT